MLQRALLPVEFHTIGCAVSSCQKVYYDTDGMRDTENIFWDGETICTGSCKKREIPWCPTTAVPLMGAEPQLIK